MHQTHLFTGSAVAAVDPEGWVSPPGFVATSGAGALFVTAHEDAPCLVALRDEGREALAVELERRRLADERSGASPADHAARARKLFGAMEEAPRDAHGRIRVSALGRHRAAIGAAVLFVGVGGAVEMWGLEAALQQGDEILSELARTHLERATPRGHEE